MTDSCVHFREHYHRLVILLTLFTAAIAPPASAQSRSFSGPYAGADIGLQHYIGGSLVDDVDTLQEDTRAVFSVFGGLRGQVGLFVVGGDLGYGRTDGDLHLDEADAQLAIDYDNDSQWHWAIHAGPLVKSRTLLFVYVSEVTRQFDVTVTRAGQITTQDDEQGMLRFGGGVEHRLTDRLHLRVTAGTSRADFGDRRTNITAGRRFELGGGVVFQF